jgi:hypothetical protein
MKCWHCGAELIWGCDHDLNEDDPGGEFYIMVTNLSCPECRAAVDVYLPRSDES